MYIIVGSPYAWLVGFGHFEYGAPHARNSVVLVVFQ